MAALGKLTSMVLLVAVAGGVLVGIRSVPDIQRYLKIRNM